MRSEALKSVAAAIALASAAPATAQNVSLQQQSGPAVPSAVSGLRSDLPPRNGVAAVEPAAMEGMIAAQNNARQRIGLPPLTWSSELAAKAETSASAAATANCSINTTMRSAAAEGVAAYWAAGLNRLGGAPGVQNILPSFVVYEWSAGRPDYDLARHMCRREGACDQYAKMVSPAAKQVGCAKAVCPSQAQIWICRYNDSAPARTATSTNR